MPTEPTTPDLQPEIPVLGSPAESPAVVNRRRSTARVDSSLVKVRDAADAADSTDERIREARAALELLDERHAPFRDVNYGVALLFLLVGVGLPVFTYVVDQFLLAPGTRYLVGFGGVTENETRRLFWTAKLAVPAVMVGLECAFCAWMVAARAQLAQYDAPTWRERLPLLRVQVLAVTVVLVVGALTAGAVLKQIEVSERFGRTVNDSDLLILFGMVAAAVGLHLAIAFSEQLGHNGRVWTLYRCARAIRSRKLRAATTSARRRRRAVVDAFETHRAAVERHNERYDETRELGPLDDQTARVVNRAVQGQGAAQDVDDADRLDPNSPPAPTDAPASTFVPDGRGDGAVGEPAAAPLPADPPRQDADDAYIDHLETLVDARRRDADGVVTP